jgi:Lon protease-like protein
MSSFLEIKLPETLPLLPMEGFVLMPRTQLVVPINELESLGLVADAVKNDLLIGIVQLNSQAHSNTDHHGNDLYTTGTLSKVLEINDMESRRILVTVGGICRFTISSIVINSSGYRIAEVSYERYAADIVQGTDFTLNRERLIPALKAYFHRLEIKPDWKEIVSFSNEKLVTALAMACPFHSQEKQAILEVSTLQEQSEMLTKLLEISSFTAPFPNPTIH